MDELIDSGLSQRKAALSLEEEQTETLGEILYNAHSLRARYGKITGKWKGGTKGASKKSEPKIQPEPEKKQSSADKFREERKQFWEEYESKFTNLVDNNSFSPIEKGMCGEFLKFAYHGLSKKYHPDTGGSNNDMKTLNNINDKLIRLVLQHS
jgi:hypothetical protein